MPPPSQAAIDGLHRSQAIVTALLNDEGDLYRTMISEVALAPAEEIKAVVGSLAGLLAGQVTATAAARGEEAADVWRRGMQRSAERRGF